MLKHYTLIIRPLIFIFFITIPLSCTHRDDYLKTDDNIIRAGTISHEDINEASGIAVSRLNEDILWIINDSGCSASVYAVNTKGDRIATLDIEGVSNYDWEDLASFEYMGKPYILVADVGDNFGKRKNCVLHFIEEPDIRNIPPEAPLSVRPSWSMEYTYEDGPRDCEAVAVDTVNKRILLLSKRDRPPVLYELPLEIKGNAVAGRLGTIKPLPQAIEEDEVPSYAAYPTAMDISADSKHIIVLTYNNALYFSRNKSSDWTEVLSGSPKEIVFPPLPQAESVCFSRDGKEIYITTEQLPAPLFKANVR